MCSDVGFFLCYRQTLAYQCRFQLYSSALYSADACAPSICIIEIIDVRNKAHLDVIYQCKNGLRYTMEIILDSCHEWWMRHLHSISLKQNHISNTVVELEPLENNFVFTYGTLVSTDLLGDSIFACNASLTAICTDSRWSGEINLEQICYQQRQCLKNYQYTQEIKVMSPKKRIVIILPDRPESAAGFVNGVNAFMLRKPRNICWPEWTVHYCKPHWVFMHLFITIIRKASAIAL